MFRNRPLWWLYFYQIRSACSTKLWKKKHDDFMYVLKYHVFRSYYNTYTKKNIWLWYPTKKKYLALILSTKNYLAFIWTQKNIWLPIKYKAPPPPPGYQMGRPLWGYQTWIIKRENNCIKQNKVYPHGCQTMLYMYNLDWVIDITKPILKFELFQIAPHE